MSVFSEFDNVGQILQGQMLLSQSCIIKEQPGKEPLKVWSTSDE